MGSKELIKIIELHGWELVRTKGSHHTYKKNKTSEILTIPHPKKDLPIGTVNQILKKAGIK